MQLIETNQLIGTGTGRGTSNSNKTPPFGVNLWIENAEKMLQERNIIIKFESPSK